MLRGSLTVLMVALVSACGSPTSRRSAPAETSTAPSSAPESVRPVGPGAGGGAPGASSCGSLLHDATETHGFHRDVRGEHRACSADEQCVSVKLDCSNVRCSAVHHEHAPAYSDPIDCAGYTGTVVDYDCAPQFDSEAPRCVEGCCTSVRIVEP